MILVGRFIVQYPNVEEQLPLDFSHSCGHRRTPPGWLPLLVSLNGMKLPSLGCAQWGAKSVLACGEGRTGWVRGT